MASGLTVHHGEVGTVESSAATSQPSSKLKPHVTNRKTRSGRNPLKSILNPLKSVLNPLHQPLRPRKNTSQHTRPQASLNPHRFHEESVNPWTNLALNFPICGSRAPVCAKPRTKPSHAGLKRFKTFLGRFL